MPSKMSEQRNRTQIAKKPDTNSNKLDPNASKQHQLITEIPKAKSDSETNHRYEPENEYIRGRIIKAVFQLALRNVRTSYKYTWCHMSLSKQGVLSVKSTITAAKIAS